MSYTKLLTAATPVDSDATDTKDPELLTPSDNEINDLSQPLGLSIDTTPSIQVLSVEDPSRICLICYKDLNMSKTRCVTLTPPPHASEPVSKTWHESCMTQYMKDLNIESKPFQVPQTSIILSTIPKFKPSGTIPPTEKISLPSLSFYNRKSTNRPKSSKYSKLPKPPKRSCLQSPQPQPDVQSQTGTNEVEIIYGEDGGKNGKSGQRGKNSNKKRDSTLNIRDNRLNSDITPKSCDSSRLSATYIATASAIEDAGEFEPVLNMKLLQGRFSYCQKPILWCVNIMLSLSIIWGVLVLILIQYSIRISLLPGSIKVESNGVYYICNIEDIKDNLSPYSIIWIIIALISLTCKFTFFTTLFCSNWRNCKKCCMYKRYNEIIYNKIVNNDINDDIDDIIIINKRFQRSQKILLVITIINSFIVGFSYGYVKIDKHIFSPYYKDINNWPENGRIDDWAFLESVIICFIMIGIIFTREITHRGWRIQFELKCLWAIVTMLIITATGYVAIIRMINDGEKSNNYGALVAIGEGETVDYLGYESFEHTNCNYVENKDGDRMIYKSKISGNGDGSSGNDDNDEWSVMCKVVETKRREIDLIADDNDLIGTITVGENGYYLSCIMREGERESRDDDDTDNEIERPNMMDIRMGQCKEHKNSGMVICYDEVEYKTSCLEKWRLITEN